MALKLILLMPVCTALLLLLSWLLELRRDRLRHVYLGLAEQYGGRYRAGGFWECPSVQFAHEGMPAVLLASNEIVHVDAQCPGGTSSRYYTQLHIAWPDESRCEIAPRARFDWHHQGAISASCTQ